MGKRRLRKLYKKENLKTKISLRTENLEDELYQLQSKKAKVWQSKVISQLLVRVQYFISLEILVNFIEY